MALLLLLLLLLSPVRAKPTYLPKKTCLGVDADGPFLLDEFSSLQVKTAKGFPRFSYKLVPWSKGVRG